MNIILRVHHLDIAYGMLENRRKVLDDISFHVNEGEFTAIMGVSGSGKTALLRCIAGIDRASRGSVLIKDRDLVMLSDQERITLRRDQLGVVFEDSNLLPALTGVENIALPLSIRREPSRQIQKKVHAMMEEFDLHEAGKLYPYQMSASQKQGVSAARAMVANPAILLADEPTDGLDEQSARLILDRFQQLNQETKTTILMATRDARVASCCNRILFMKAGRLVHEIYRDPVSQEDYYHEIIDVMAVLEDTICR